MTSIFSRHRRNLNYMFYSLISVLFLGSTPAWAQNMLEEIVVTAQRREQSLQDVPIAIDVISADSIQKEGFDNLEELTAFSPGVFVNEGGDQGSDTFIRGFGTVGRNWANDSATPMFLDNVNLGQSSMGAIAFMDSQRVEILKGPQPIHFGLNATGGALSIVSARPTDSWEGYVNVEMGQTGEMNLWKRMGDKELEGAVGGPLTDTLSFRVAGRYASTDGHLRDSVTGYPMGYRNFAGTRIALEWRPTDNLSVYSKFELARQEWDGNLSRVCRREGDYPNRFDRNDAPSLDAVETDPTAVWVNFGQGGTGFATPHLAIDPCGSGGTYVGQTASFEQPTYGVRTRDTTEGFMDIRAAATHFYNNLMGGTIQTGSTMYGDNDYLGFKGNGTGVSRLGYQQGQSQEPMNFQVDLNYRFDNGIEMQWTNNYMTSNYVDVSVGRNTPYVENIRNRLEDYKQKSTELRISSYGGGPIEWMVGAFIQKEKLHFTTLDMRSEIRFGNRLNDNYQDATWSSYFGNVTFNFYDDKMSLDAGIRYSHAKKDPTLRSYNSSWIFDVTPCRGDGAADTDNNFRGSTQDWGGLAVQDVTPDDCVAGLEPQAENIDAEDAVFIVNSLQNRGVNTNNLWFVPRSSERDTPSTWRGPYTAAVGITPWTFTGREDEQWDNLAEMGTQFGVEPVTSWDHWDPQLVLRYRPTPELSTYFKYATAFKAGGYDLGFGGSQPGSNDPPPGGLEELQIDPEYSDTFELGASGTAFDGRARYTATLFRVDFDDLIATTVTGVGTDDQSTVVINIGKQRAQGFEFSSQYAWSDQMTLGLTAQYLDSKFTYFPDANCTLHETINAAETGCVVTFAPGGSDPRNPDDVEYALIDRAGQTAAYAPKFGMTFTADYWVPFKGYKVDMGSTVTYQSSYYTDFRTFDKATIQEGAADLNLHLGIGDMNDKWRVGLALRNLLEPRETFRSEYTSDITELGTETLRTNQVRSVALTFKYNFFQ
jgi:outer membrane receptor protein involved in Fe transport